MKSCVICALTPGEGAGWGLGAGMFQYKHDKHAVLQVHPDSKIHGANTGPTWALSAPGGPRVVPTNLAIRAGFPIVKIRRSR